MHKIKRAIDRLRQYLGRDHNGIAILDEIAGIGNALRKQVATEIQSAADSAARAADMRSDLAKAEKTIRSQREEVAHEQSLRRARDTDVDRLESQVANLTAELEKLLPERIPVPECAGRVSGLGADRNTIPETVRDMRLIADVLNVVRRKMRRCPKPSFIASERPDHVKRAEKIYIYELTDIADSLAAEKLLLLGQFVACQCLVGMPCAITAEVNFIDMPAGGPKLNDKVKERFLRWFVKNNVRLGPLEKRSGYQHCSPILGGDDYFASELR